MREHSFVHRLRPELGRSARARYFRRSISRGEHVRTGRADSSRFVLKLIDRELTTMLATPLGVDFESESCGIAATTTARWCKRTSDVGVRRMLSGELSRAKPGDGVCTDEPANPSRNRRVKTFGARPIQARRPPLARSPGASASLPQRSWYRGSPASSASLREGARW